MSIPHVYLKCDLCEEEWSQGALVGRCSYELPDGRLADLDRMLSWCNSCQTYVPVEKFQTREKLDRKLASALKNFKEAQIPVESRILGLFKTMKNPDPDRLKYSQRNFEEAQATRDWIDLRKYPPRCLCCGSQDISPKSAFKSPEYHHNCGGMVTSRENENLRIAYVLQHKIYDTEGNFLRIEKKDS